MKSRTGGAMAKVINFNPGKNVKAGIFEKYMKDNELNFFQRRDTHDEKDSVAFITAIPAGSHRLVAAVITDNSMYTLLRIHLGVAPAGPARKTFVRFLEQLNAAHSIFKYSIAEDDNTFLDICVTTRPESFDPEVVRTSLNLIIFHLKDNYEDIARRLSKPGDASDGFEL